MHQFLHFLALGRCAHYHPEVFRLDALDQFAQARLFCCRTDFLRHRHLFAKRHQHHVAACKRDLRGQSRTFGRDRLFYNLHQQLAAGRKHIGHRSVLVNLRQAGHFIDVGHFLLIVKNLLHHRRVHCKVRAQIQVVKERILFISHIDEGGIKSRHQLFDFCQINVAHGIGNVSCLFLE